MIEAQQIERFNRAKMRLKTLLEKTMIGYADTLGGADPVWASMKQAKAGTLQMVDRLRKMEDNNRRMLLELKKGDDLAKEAMEGARETEDINRRILLEMGKASDAAREAMEGQYRAVSLLIQRREAERDRRSKGGKARAAKLKAQPMPDWMRELFERAYALLDMEGKARIGHVNLLGVAWRMAGPGHPDRDQLTEHRARQYLKTHRKPPR